MKKECLEEKQCFGRFLLLLPLKLRRSPDVARSKKLSGGDSGAKEGKAASGASSALGTSGEEDEVKGLVASTEA